MLKMLITFTATSIILNEKKTKVRSVNLFFNDCVTYPFANSFTISIPRTIEKKNVSIFLSLMIKDMMMSQNIKNRKI
jgi:hypothetical protein